MENKSEFEFIKFYSVLNTKSVGVLGFLQFVYLSPPVTNKSLIAEESAVG